MFYDDGHATDDAKMADIIAAYLKQCLVTVTAEKFALERAMTEATALAFPKNEELQKAIVGLSIAREALATYVQTLPADDRPKLYIVT